MLEMMMLTTADNSWHQVDPRIDDQILGNPGIEVPEANLGRSFDDSAELRVPSKDEVWSALEALQPRDFLILLYSRG
jgi:hypothetical protein